MLNPAYRPRTRKKRQPNAAQSSQTYQATSSGVDPRTGESVQSPRKPSSDGTRNFGTIVSPEISTAQRSSSLSEGRNWYEDTINRLVSPKGPPAPPTLESQGLERPDAPELIAHSDETNEASPEAKTGILCNIDHQILQLKSSYQLPPRAIRESLNDAFMERCYPWTPIIERSWLEDEGGKSVSLLLRQAVFLAASRVSSSPSIVGYATPREFYQRAKTLFWTGYERDALMTIRAACILNWFNPHGPEQVSFDTSRFWNHIAIGLAHQISLHKEPPPGRTHAMRRRLWWSLVVCHFPMI